MNAGLGFDCCWWGGWSWSVAQGRWLRQVGSGLVGGFKWRFEGFREGVGVIEAAAFEGWSGRHRPRRWSVDGQGSLVFAIFTVHIASE